MKKKYLKPLVEFISFLVEEKVANAEDEALAFYGVTGPDTSTPMGPTNPFGR